MILKKIIMYGIYSNRLNGFLTAGSYEYCFTTKDNHIRLEYEDIGSCKNAIEQYKVYSHVSKTAESLGIENDKKQRLLNEMSEAQQKYITDNIREAKIWLQTLLEDLNGA